jgi:molecular chaperone HscB
MTYSADIVPDQKAAEESPAAAQCWSCSSPLRSAELFCGACGSIQPLSAEVNYFEVFGLPRKLRLDTAALGREFYRLSRRLHPDVYARASQQEQDWSLANSSLLNDAYRTLKDPVRRAEYLLKLEGIVSADQGGTNPGGTKKEDRVPADLLEEVFELNMQLDEMRMTRQMGENDPQLQKDLLVAKANFDAQFKSTDASLEGLWDKWDGVVDVGDEVQKQSAKEEMAALLDRRRYIRNLVNSVNEALGL